MRRIVNDILKGKDLEPNLSRYVDEMKDIYGRYAVVRLALNYYTFFQIDTDEDLKGETHKEISKNINRVIRDAVLDNKMTRDEAIAVLEEDRKKIMLEASALTYFVDAFKIYEYVLNRIEYRFKNEEIPSSYSDEEFTKMIMQYIFSDEDNVVINSKISEIVAELPVRMTKNKFYEYVTNSLSIYNGTERKSLDDFLYMIKTSSTLLKDDEYNKLFPELLEVYETLKNTDYSAIEEEEYKMLVRSIEDVSEYIEQVMNISMILMEILNDTYAIVLSGDVNTEYKYVNASKEIIASVNDYFILGSMLDEETENLFIDIEGSQEELYQKISVYNILDEISTSYANDIQSYDAKDGIGDLNKLAILLADSIFVELDVVDDNSLVDDEVLAVVGKELLEAFKTLFESNKKNVNRAVMATVMAQLPVFFNNVSELQDFVYNALTGCTDKTEKMACVEVLHQIMEE